jgi:hypothetical protein
MLTFLWVLSGIAVSGVIVMIIAGDIFLIMLQGARGRAGLTSPDGRGPRLGMFSTNHCPTCGRPLQADWRICPYDGAKVA